jgi:hypothetical protein
MTSIKSLWYPTIPDSVTLGKFKTAEILQSARVPVNSVGTTLGVEEGSTDGVTDGTAEGEEDGVEDGAAEGAEDGFTLGFEEGLWLGAAVAGKVHFPHLILHLEAAMGFFLHRLLFIWAHFFLPPISRGIQPDASSHTVGAGVAGVGAGPPHASHVLGHLAGPSAYFLQKNALN